MVPVIKSPPSFNLKNIGRHMPRDRYQHGWIEETGKKVKKWKGHYYVYVLTLDGICQPGAQIGDEKMGSATGTGKGH